MNALSLIVDSPHPTLSSRPTISADSDPYAFGTFEHNDSVNCGNIITNIMSAASINSPYTLFDDSESAAAAPPIITVTTR